MKYYTKFGTSVTHMAFRTATAIKLSIKLHYIGEYSRAKLKLRY